MTRHPTAHTDELRLVVRLRVDAIADQMLEALAVAWQSDQESVEAALEGLAAAVGDGENTGGTLAEVRDAREELQAVAQLPDPETSLIAAAAMHLADEIRAAAHHTQHYRRIRHLRAA